MANVRRDKDGNPVAQIPQAILARLLEWQGPRVSEEDEEDGIFGDVSREDVGESTFALCAEQYGFPMDLLVYVDYFHVD